MTDQITEFSGYHKFRGDDGSEYGSFEVFQETERCFTGEDVMEPGWYWWSCFPGCLPDGEQHGPFPTAEGAYLDAMEGDAGVRYVPDTAIEEGTRFERLSDGNDLGG